MVTTSRNELVRRLVDEVPGSVDEGEAEFIVDKISSLSKRFREEKEAFDSELLKRTAVLCKGREGKTVRECTTEQEIEGIIREMDYPEDFGLIASAVATIVDRCMSQAEKLTYLQQKNVRIPEGCDVSRLVRAWVDDDVIFLIVSTMGKLDSAVTQSVAHPELVASRFVDSLTSYVSSVAKKKV